MKFRTCQWRVAGNETLTSMAGIGWNRSAFPFEISQGQFIWRNELENRIILVPFVGKETYGCRILIEWLGWLTLYNRHTYQQNQINGSLKMMRIFSFAGKVVVSVTSSMVHFYQRVYRRTLVYNV